MTALAHPAATEGVGVFCLESELPEHPPEEGAGPEPPREELARLQEENQRLRAELERRSAVPGPASLTHLRTGELMDATGVEARDISPEIKIVQGQGLSVKKANSYRARERVAVEFALRNKGSAETWAGDQAVLVGAHGEELEILSVWTTGPIPPGGRGRVLVEAVGAPASGAYTLRVWRGDGARALIIENVTFPGPLRSLPGGRP
jgi:uncharacterized protein (TIGR02268 family)